MAQQQNAYVCCVKGSASNHPPGIAAGRLGTYVKPPAVRCMFDEERKKKEGEDAAYAIQTSGRLALAVCRPFPPPPPFQECPSHSP